MEIEVESVGSRRGVTEYALTPKHRPNNGWPTPRDARRMLALKPRIAKMARRQLGQDLQAVTTLGSDMVLIHVKVGTSRGPKKEALKNLLGWAALCAVEK